MFVKAANSQIQKIHIAIKELGIDDESHRKNLSAFENEITGSPIKSSSELSFGQAEEYLAKLSNASFQVKFKTEGNQKFSQGKGKMKYEELADRGEEWATPAQLRMIEALWRQCSREKSDKALQSFLVN